MRRIIFLLLAVCTSMITSCTRQERRRTPVKQAAVQQPTEPTFNKVSEFIAFRDLSVKEAQEDSLFLTLPEHLLKQVATVVINRDSVCTKHTVITEYITNAAVYDNLGQQEQPKIIEIHDTIYVPAETPPDTNTEKIKELSSIEKQPSNTK